jgi:hypothetical protein
MRSDRYGVWCAPTETNKTGEPGWLPHDRGNGKTGWPLRTARAKARSLGDNALMSRHWTYEVRRLSRATAKLPFVRAAPVFPKHCTACGSPEHNLATCTEDRRLPLPFKTGLRAEPRPRRRARVATLEAIVARVQSRATLLEDEQ